MWRTLILALVVGACTPAQPAADPAENEPIAQASNPSPQATTPPPAEAATPKPTTTTTHAPKPVPPLSSPNSTAKPVASADDAGAPSGDPRTEALRRIGVIGQRCHEKNTPGVNGQLALEIALGADGTIEKARVIKERSTAALVGGALERCVLDAVKKEKFPPPRGEDVVLDVPLSFKPGP